MARLIPFTQARSELSNILDDLAARHEHFVITRGGRPAAVVLSVDEYECLQETLDVLGDDQLMAQLEAPDDDADLLEWDEVKRDLQAKRGLA